MQSRQIPTSEPVSTKITPSSRIPVAAPVLDGNEKKYVLECLDTEWISSNGRFIPEFERAFADYCGVKHAIATNNGTTALHLALVALGIKEGDEVIVPTLTYVATANAVRYCNATPVFVDSDSRTFNIDINSTEAAITDRTKVILPVHLYGHPVDMNPLRELADRYNLMLLEDAAEAVGAEYFGRRVGGLGDAAAFSFFGNKIITTGEGGMVTTNSDDLAEKLRIYRGQGMDPNRRYWFPVIGYNYRMTNIAAAIGLAQMERIDHHLERRQEIGKIYQELLSDITSYVDLPFIENWAKHSYWMYVIVLKESVKKSRDEVMSELDGMGIETRPVFYPMHVMPPFFQDRSYPNADYCAQRGINLPTHGRMSKEDVKRVCNSLKIALDR